MDVQEVGVEVVSREALEGVVMALESLQRESDGAKTDVEQLRDELEEESRTMSSSRAIREPLIWQIKKLLNIDDTTTECTRTESLLSPESIHPQPSPVTPLLESPIKAVLEISEPTEKPMMRQVSSMDPVKLEISDIDETEAKEDETDPRVSEPSDLEPSEEHNVENKLDHLSLAASEEEGKNEATPTEVEEWGMPKAVEANEVDVVEAREADTVQEERQQAVHDEPAVLTPTPVVTLPPTPTSTPTPVVTPTPTPTSTPAATPPSTARASPMQTSSSTPTHVAEAALVTNDVVVQRVTEVRNEVTITEVAKVKEVLQTVENVAKEQTVEKVVKELTVEKVVQEQTVEKVAREQTVRSPTPTPTPTKKRQVEVPVFSPQAEEVMRKHKLRLEKAKARENNKNVVQEPVVLDELNKGEKQNEYLRQLLEQQKQLQQMIQQRQSAREQVMPPPTLPVRSTSEASLSSVPVRLEFIESPSPRPVRIIPPAAPHHPVPQVRRNMLKAVDREGKAPVVVMTSHTPSSSPSPTRVNRGVTAHPRRVPQTKKQLSTSRSPSPHRASPKRRTLSTSAKPVPGAPNDRPPWKVVGRYEAHGKGKREGKHHPLLIAT
eukprot:TRINITY_DN4516_c0_g1_i4.p1 TRINITY_DN4516_c0_g1~~TRINITY_DN4516_c0_g1_i4.p1  ORF type:complete len:607 (+),score=147.96 TRINITY_DN4516_c0_g1_i4:58-1878(+)